MIHIRGAVLDRIGSPRPYSGSSGSQPISVVELDLDAPGPGEVLVHIEAAGVCHSDLSVVDGNRVRPVPMLLGHEAAGIIEALGAGCRRCGRRPAGRAGVLAAVRPLRGMRDRGPGAVRTGQCGQHGRHAARWRDPARAGRPPGVPPPRRFGFRDARRRQPGQRGSGAGRRATRRRRLLGCAVLTVGARCSTSATRDQVRLSPSSASAASAWRRCSPP